MITTIIFSFDRAMQLDKLLESIVRFDTSKKINLYVLYSTSSSEYEAGYQELNKKFSSVKWKRETSFKESFVWPKFSFYWRNYYWWFKYGYNRSIKSNFKSLLLSIMENSVDDSIMFLTDDSIFVNQIDIKSALLQKVENHGFKFSYSLRHGENIIGGNYKKNTDFIEWNIINSNKHSDWNYPFSVDGHIYNIKAMLEIFRKVIFKNPNTLEGNVVCYVEDKQLLKHFVANEQSCLLGFELNRVQTIADNNSLDICNKTLNELFLSGYELNLDYKLKSKHLFRPTINKVTATRNNQTKLLYEQ